MDDLKELTDAAGRGDLDSVRATLKQHPELASARDGEGATALHYAALGGHRAVAELLVESGADVNARDSTFGATPAGWAIEYLRELGGFLGIELSDFAFAIERGDVEWASRFLKRFPALRSARDGDGRTFREIAEEKGMPEILRLFPVQ